jgi:mycofactocin precursor peptide peptidase
MVPLGSLEQHGPHLPLDTDTRIAVAVARGAAAGPRRRGGGARARVRREWRARRLSRHAVDRDRRAHRSAGRARCDASRDWDAMLLVNAHGGNREAIDASLARLHAEGRRCAAYHVAPASGDAHAGRTETALLLHLCPTAVRLDLAEPGEVARVSELIDRLRRDGVRPVSPNGVLGDPRGATADEGRRLLEHVVAGCIHALAALLGVERVHA